MKKMTNLVLKNLSGQKEVKILSLIDEFGGEFELEYVTSDFIDWDNIYITGFLLKEALGLEIEYIEIEDKTFFKVKVPTGFEISSDWSLLEENKDGLTLQYKFPIDSPKKNEYYKGKTPYDKILWKLLKPMISKLPIKNS